MIVDFSISNSQMRSSISFESEAYDGAAQCDLNLNFAPSYCTRDSMAAAAALFSLALAGGEVKVRRAGKTVPVSAAAAAPLEAFFDPREVRMTELSRTPSHLRAGLSTWILAAGGAAVEAGNAALLQLTSEGYGSLISYKRAMIGSNIALWSAAHPGCDAGLMALGTALFLADDLSIAELVLHPSLGLSNDALSRAADLGPYLGLRIRAG